MCVRNETLAAVHLTEFIQKDEIMDLIEDASNSAV